jgi:hypothetical protein
MMLEESHMYKAHYFYMLTLSFKIIRLLLLFCCSIYNVNMENSLYSQKLSFCDEICAFMESRGI